MDLALNIVVPEKTASLTSKVSKRKVLKATETVVRKSGNPKLPVGLQINKKQQLTQVKPRKPSFIKAKSGKSESHKPFLLSKTFNKPLGRADITNLKENKESGETSEGFTISFVKPTLFHKKQGQTKNIPKVKPAEKKKPDDEPYHSKTSTSLESTNNTQEGTTNPKIVDFISSEYKAAVAKGTPFKSKRRQSNFTQPVIKTNKWFDNPKPNSGTIHVVFPPKEAKESAVKKNDFFLSSHQDVIPQGKAKHKSGKDDEERIEKTINVNKERTIKRTQVSPSFDHNNKEEMFKKDNLKTDRKNIKSSGPMSSLFDHSDVVGELEVDDGVKPLEERLFSRKTFSDVGLHQHLIGNLEQLFGITNMTVVQKKTIPILMTGKDAMVRSQTGSGKTLAYALPIMQALQGATPKLTRKDGVKALVVLPTRELALQTYECFTKLMRAFTWIVPGIVVGGEKRKSEKVRLRKGINVLVGTPGRLLDHAENTGNLSLHGIDWLIIDEADKLLEMGYEKDVSKLVSIIDEQRQQSENPGRKQTVMLSATLTSDVERLANVTLQNPEHIDACIHGVQETTDVLVIPQSLQQKYIIVPAKLRLVALSSFLIYTTEQKKSNKILIFMATQDMIDFFTDLIQSVLSSSVQFFKLHGNMAQGDRTEVFNSFRKSDKGVLLSTDVAARGLDLPKVDWIVQYNAPTTPAEYVHRVGRTARVGEFGSSLLFLLPSELHFVSMLNSNRIRLEEAKVDNYLKCLMNAHLESKDGQRWGGGVEGAATVLQHNFEHAVLEDEALHELACKAYKSWVRFYATYPKDLRVVFDFKSLHLGHNAKSFALRDAPKAIGGIGKPKKGNKIDKDRKPRKRKAEGIGHVTEFSKTKKLILSEFDSGLKSSKKI